MLKKDELKRRDKIRRKFRLVIRLVIINRLWLMEVEDQKIGSNVKRNIAMLIRPRTRTGLLTLKDKTLIKIPAWSRTIDERKHLIKILSSLTCFEQIPPKLTARLAPYIKYLLLNPGKTFIKEGHEPLAVYFVLTGEVVLTRKEGDRDVVKLIHGPGSTVGETEILNGTKRTHSAKTAALTELLTIFITEYNQVLFPYMNRQWQFKKKVIEYFDYFTYYTDEQKSCLGKIAILKEYKSLDTIYTADEGNLSMSYFVISGQCMILQSLRVKVEQKGLRKRKTLCKLNDIECNQLFKQSRIKEAYKYRLSEIKSKTNLSVDSELLDVIQIFDKTAHKRYESPCGVVLKSKKQAKATVEEQIKKNDLRNVQSTTSFKSRIRSFVNVANKNYIGSTKSFPSIANERKVKIQESEISYEMHFIDVGNFTSGSVFGLGEKMEHRAIMARTTCQLLLIPRYWLLDKKQNIGKQWEKCRVSLNEIIPSRELLYDDYIATCNWERYKRDLTDAQITKKTNTKIEDIPIICRILESI